MVDLPVRCGKIHEKDVKWANLSWAGILGPSFDKRGSYFNNALSWILQYSRSHAPGGFYDADVFGSPMFKIICCGIHMEVIAALLKEVGK